MKKPISIILTLLFILSASFAQNPAINYQAVARDANGNVLANSNINVRFQFREGSAAGPIVYQETFNPKTNDFGLFYLAMGEGTAEIGIFEDIDWSADDMYLITEINGSKIDTSLFRSVPYSKIATDMKLSDLTDVSDNPAANKQALVWNGSRWEPGNAVVITGSGATTVSGTYPNFVISSTDEVDDADADPTNEIQTLSLSGSTLNLSQGGGSVNLPTSPWLSSGNNIYYTAGNVGIGDASPSASLTVGNGDKFQVDGNSGTLTFADPQAGIVFPAIAGSSVPMITMFSSGTSNDRRMLIGHSPDYPQWGLEYEDARDVFLFTRPTLFSSASLPVFHIGLGSGHIGILTDTPEAQLHIKKDPLFAYNVSQLLLEGGSYDSLLIDYMFNGSVYWRVRTGTQGISYRRMYTNLPYAEPLNIYTGGISVINKDDNYVRIYRGYVTGALGYANVNILSTGYRSGISTGSIYGLYAKAQPSSIGSNPNCYGVVGSSTITNTRVNVGIYGRASQGNWNYGVMGYAPTASNSYAGYFNGDVYATGNYLPSDRRLKEDVEALSDGLQAVLALHPKRYHFRKDMQLRMNLPESQQYGFVADDVKRVLPQLVKESYHLPLINENGDEERASDPEEGISFEAVNYTGMIPVIVSAMQEQQELIEEKDARIRSLESQVQALNRRLGQLERLTEKLSRP